MEYQVWHLGDKKLRNLELASRHIWRQGVHCHIVSSVAGLMSLMLAFQAHFVFCTLKGAQ